MTVSQVEKGNVFRALHERQGAFIIPNPWDIGTARILAGLGFEALATTSAGYAFSIGKADNTVGRDGMIEHVREIVESVDLPVSADLENGFSDDPKEVAETIRLGVAAGLVGGSIEDSTRHREAPVYELEHAVDRVRAAVEVTRGLGFSFMLTARAENFIVGRRDLADTIKRLQAYQEAGADVLYAPGLTTRDEIAAVISSIDRPLNVLMGFSGAKLNHAELSELGVRRISIGSGLSRVSFDAVVRAGREMLEQGTFRFADDVIGSRDIVGIQNGRR